MRQRLGAVGLSLAIALLLVGGTHLYFARRLVIDPGYPMAAAWVIALLGVSIVVAPFARRRFRPSLARLVTLPAALWLGLAFLLLTALLAAEVTFVAVGLFESVALAGLGDVFDPGFFDPRFRAQAVLALAGTAAAVGLVSALQPPKRRRVELEVPRWPRDLDGFRIVQITDVHIGPVHGRRFAELVTGRVNALEPDLVAVTGDIVDGRVEGLAADVAPFAGIRARHGVFFVTGNHEYFSKADPWVEHFRTLGWHPLRNGRVTIGAGAASFELAGVDDHYARRLGPEHGEDLGRALEGRAAERPVVLLAHNPTVFDQAADAGVDLQLSGHTHGGQIWPFGYVVRMVVPYLAGRYRKNGSQLYVSRGTGFWGPPMRLFAPAEITEIVVRSHGNGKEAP